MARRSLIERIVDERVGQTTVGTLSVAVDRMAEELAREVLADDDFRQSFRALIRVRSRELMDRLLRERTPTRGAASNAAVGRSTAAHTPGVAAGQTVASVITTPPRGRRVRTWSQAKNAMLSEATAELGRVLIVSRGAR